MSALTRTHLEALLEQRRLPVLGPAPPRHAPLPTGIFPIDRALAGGIPSGQVSEIHGPASSGRTGLVQALVARTTREGSLATWLDPGDRLDPATVSAAGADLARLLWLRGGGGERTLERSLSALGVLLGSGIFHLVVLDLAGLPAAALRVPGATWIRLGRMIEDTATALVLLAGSHVACGPRGASLALDRAGPRWSGAPGPARLFQGFEAQGRVGRHVVEPAAFALQAIH